MSNTNNVLKRLLIWMSGAPSDEQETTIAVQNTRLVTEDVEPTVYSEDMMQWQPPLADETDLIELPWEVVLPETVAQNALSESSAEAAAHDEPLWEAVLPTDASEDIRADAAVEAAAHHEPLWEAVLPTDASEDIRTDAAVEAAAYDEPLWEAVLPTDTSEDIRTDADVEAVVHDESLWEPLLTEPDIELAAEGAALEEDALWEPLLSEPDIELAAEGAMLQEDALWEPLLVEPVVAVALAEIVSDAQPTPPPADDKLLAQYWLFGEHTSPRTAIYLELARPALLAGLPTFGFHTTEAQRAREVIIIGDETDVSAETETLLRNAGCAVQRIHGPAAQLATALNALLPTRI